MERRLELFFNYRIDQKITNINAIFLFVLTFFDSPLRRGDQKKIIYLLARQAKKLLAKTVIVGGFWLRRINPIVLFVAKIIFYNL
jgi:hypothetical protein